MSRFPSPADAAAVAASSDAGLGDLPEWNLADLYPSMDSEAFTRDLARALVECQAFAADYKGKLGTFARDGGLIDAVRRYEAIDDLLGRIMSYAGLVYAGDTTDPVRAKFYGDAQDKITQASTDLLFFALELNRVDDAVLDAAAAGELAHYKPWLDDLRKDKPYQLDDKVEQLFLEKSTTGASAWNRLFDETLASIRFSVDGEELPLEPTLSTSVNAKLLGQSRCRTADRSRASPPLSSTSCFSGVPRPASSGSRAALATASDSTTAANIWSRVVANDNPVNDAVRCSNPVRDPAR